MSIWTKRSCEATGHHLRSALSATLDKSGVWAWLDEWNARHIPAWLNWCQKLKWSPAALVVLWHAVWDECTNTNTDKTVNAIWLLRAPYRGTGPEREQVVARVGEEQERWREAWNERKQEAGFDCGIAEAWAPTCPILIANWPSGCWYCANTTAGRQDFIQLCLCLLVFSCELCSPTLHWNIGLHRDHMWRKITC